jgi:hypothetical protein
MRDLEKAASREEEDEVCPLMLDIEEDGNNNNVSNKSPSSLPLSILSPKRHNKSKKYFVLCLLITVIALGTVLVPVSQGRLTSIKTAIKSINTASLTTNDGDDNDGNMTISTKERTFALEESSSAIGAYKADEAEHTATTQHLDYHTNSFDYSSSWCPNANCKGTTICYPCQRRWLIIITTGRSASTTLTEMVARLPGVRMTGENNNLIARFENVLKQSTPAMLEGKEAAWFHDNPIPEESFSCASQTLFTTFNPPKLMANTNGEMLEESDEETILGFKTIRLFDNEVKMNDNVSNLSTMQLREIVQDKVVTLHHLFPCARFVVNFRSDVQHQAASWKKQFGAKNTTKASQVIQLDNDLLHIFHNAMGRKRSFLLDSTVWTQNISSFNDMVDWLGFAQACHFPAALEYNTDKGYKATKTEVDLSQDCMYLY